MRAAVIVIHPSPQFLGGKLARRLDDRPLAVHPLRPERVHPRRPHPPAAHPDLAAPFPLDPPVVRPEPPPPALADVPGGVIPDEHEPAPALGPEPRAQPPQVVLGHLADRPPL